MPAISVVLSETFARADVADRRIPAGGEKHFDPALGKAKFVRDFCRQNSSCRARIEEKLIRAVFVDHDGKNNQRAVRNIVEWDAATLYFAPRCGIKQT